jgi:hypothetical protein
MARILNNGIEVCVEWHKFTVGSSFYIPTLDPEALVKAVRKEAAVHGMKIASRMVTEGTTMGVRIWRVDDDEYVDDDYRRYGYIWRQSDTDETVS